MMIAAKTPQRCSGVWADYRQIDLTQHHAAWTSWISGQKCFRRFSMPWRNVAVELGQPEQAPRM
jgi:hypothetical protein